MDPCFEIRGNRKDKYHVALVGANGETQLTSEKYTRKADAKRAVKDAANSFIGTLGAEGVAIRDVTTK